MFHGSFSGGGFFLVFWVWPGLCRCVCGAAVGALGVGLGGGAVVPVASGGGELCGGLVGALAGGLCGVCSAAVDGQQCVVLVGFRAGGGIAGVFVTLRGGALPGLPAGCAHWAGFGAGASGVVVLPLPRVWWVGIGAGGLRRGQALLFLWLV